MWAWLGKAAAVLLTGAVLASCSHTAPQMPAAAAAKAAAHPPPGKVLLMPPDVQLSLLHTGGMMEPRADWTKTATDHIQKAIEARLRKTGNRMALYAAPPTGTPEAHLHLQLVKLHEAIGYSATRYRNLPTIKGRFDWTLGPLAEDLGKGNDADYALFVYIRDSYASGGRQAMAAVGALLFGAPVRTGRQFGFASLVDLKTGKILWLNRLAREGGDLRSYGPAQETVGLLLDKFPL